MEFYSVLLSSSFLLIIIHAILHFKHKTKLPPGPKGLPIIGSLLAVGDRPHESLTKLAKVYGPIMTVRMGPISTIVVSSTEMAREIILRNDQAFLGRPVPDAVTAQTDYELSMPWLSGDAQWKKLRKLCTSQIFTTQRLDSLQWLRHQMMDNMVQRIKEAKGTPVSIGKLVFATTFSLISNTMFSTDMLDPNSASVEEMKGLMGRIMELGAKPNMADYFPLLKPFDLQGIRKEIKVSYDRLHELLEGIIDRRLKRRELAVPRSDDLLDVLLDRNEEHGADELSRQDIKILLVDMFIGGTDTTATTMEWAMAELFHNPSTMAKTKKELKEAIGSGQSIKEQDLLKLPYLQSVIKETMRLHSIAPLLVPQSKTDVNVCGYKIPKHTQVFINLWAIFHDPDNWPDPDQFIPERFMGTDIDFRGKNLSFIPFGAGRRICPGLSLAVRMMNLLLANLLHHFDWELPDGITSDNMDMRDRFGILLQKVVPLVGIPCST